MANYATLKAAIAAAIKQNGNNEITGNLLQQQLLAIVNSLGAGYQYIGIATPDTNPGTPDQNVFYIAGPGSYPNFDNINIPDNYIGIFSYNGSWTNTLFETSPFLAQSVVDGIVQLYDGETPIYPRTKAEAVFFDNNTNKTLATEFSRVAEMLEKNLLKYNAVVRQSTQGGFIDDIGIWRRYEDYGIDYYSVPDQYTRLKFNSAFTLVSGVLHVVHYFNGNTYLGHEYLSQLNVNNYGGYLTVPVGTTTIAINRDANGQTGLFDVVEYDESIPNEIVELQGRTTILETSVGGLNQRTKTVEDILTVSNQIPISSSVDNKYLKNDGTIGSLTGYYIKYYEISDLTKAYHFKSTIIGSGINAVHYFNGETHLGYEYPVTPGTTEYSGMLQIPAGTTKIALNTQSGFEIYSTELYDGSLANKVLDNSNRITALENATEKKRIKALFIGNSLNQDHTAYIPWLLKGLYPEIEFEIYISYIGGFTIKEYVTDVINGTHKVDIFSRAINTDRWTNVNNYEYADIFTNFGPFDLISYQGFDIMPETKEEDVTYFPTFVQDLYTRQGTTPFRLGYNLIQNNRSAANWARNMACLNAALLTTPVNIVFPTGVVTELVRSDFGTAFITSDNLHNQQGLPCIMGAYTMVLQLVRYLGLPERILNNGMRITAAKETELNIPGPNGTLQIGTDAQYIEAQEAAIQAVKYIDAYCDTVNIGII